MRAKRTQPADIAKPPQKTLYSLCDHVCRNCSGGRILRQETNRGMTPGGNPIYVCANCGATSCHMGPDEICWCGLEMRGNHGDHPYNCLPYSILEEHPEYLECFLACGCDPKRGGTQVGIVSRDHLRKVRQS